MTISWSEIHKKRDEKIAEGGAVSPIDMFDPTKRAEDDIAEQRMSVCDGCEELIRFTKQCKQCGCFMAGKTKLKSATCPLGKWNV
jgi:hypothetical protein